MSTKVNPPSFAKTKSYRRYKQELLAWKEVTEVTAERQGIVVALTLPEDDETGIRERVFDEIKLEDLKKADGFQTLLNYLDKQLGKDDLEDCLLYTSPSPRDA